MEPPPFPAAPPPAIAGAPTVSLDALDFGEPSAFAEAPRSDVALEEEEPEILDLPLIDLDEELVEELEPASPVVSAAPFARAPAAPPVRPAVLAPATVLAASQPASQPAAAAARARDPR